MQKRKIGIDLDDVLIDFNTKLFEYHNLHYGTTYTREDIISYSLQHLWGCSESEKTKRILDFYHSEDHRNLLPILGARESLEELREKHSLIIVTSRPESVRELTTVLIEKHFPECFDDAHFLGHYHDIALPKKTKGDVCEALGIEIFIEDALGNALTVAEKGIPVLLFDTPWNQGEVSSLITRVFGWDNALAKFRAFSLI